MSEVPLYRVPHTTAPVLTRETDFASKMQGIVQVKSRGVEVEPAANRLILYHKSPDPGER